MVGLGTLKVTVHAVHSGRSRGQVDLLDGPRKHPSYSAGTIPNSSESPFSNQSHAV